MCGVIKKRVHKRKGGREGGGGERSRGGEIDGALGCEVGGGKEGRMAGDVG